MFFCVCFGSLYVCEFHLVLDSSVCSELFLPVCFEAGGVVVFEFVVGGWRAFNKVECGQVFPVPADHLQSFLNWLVESVCFFEKFV